VVAMVVVVVALLPTCSVSSLASLFVLIPVTGPGLALPHPLQHTHLRLHLPFHGSRTCHCTRNGQHPVCGDDMGFLGTMR
jgi:hypothetical protein